MGIQASDIDVNATQIFDVVFDEMYRIRGGTRRCGRDGGFRPATDAPYFKYPGKAVSVFVGTIRGTVPQVDEDRIPPILEGRGNDGNTYVYRRASSENKGGSIVVTYRVTMTVPSPGPLRRIAAHLKSKVVARIIRVPPKTEQAIVDRLFFETLWRLRDKFTARTKAEFSSQWQSLQVQIQTHAPKIPNHRAGTVGPASDLDLSTFWVPFTTEGMGDNYQHLTPKESRIRVGINWTGKVGSNSPTVAYWWASKNTLMVNMYNVEEFTRFPAPNWGPSVVADLLKNIGESVTHELRHAVQDLMLEQVDKAQIAIEPDYQQHGEGYYSSPVEFDPQIGSLAFEFVEYWRVHLEHGRRTTDRDRLFMMKQFVGAVPSRNMGMRVHPFFSALKVRDVGRWRTAVKKFFVEVDQTLRQPQKVTAAPKRRFKDVPRDPMGFPIFVQKRESKKRKYGEPTFEFYLTPDDVKLMKWEIDYDGFSRAARRIFGDHNDLGTAKFGQGFWFGYQRTMNAEDFRFSDADRREMGQEAEMEDDPQQLQYVVEEAEGIYQDAMRCGSRLRMAHEYYLESGTWDAPEHYTNFFSIYRPQN